MLRFALLAVGLLACDLTPKTTDSGDSGISPVYLPIADIDWKPNQIVLTIEHGAGYDFEFGIVEYWDGCKTDTIYGCWTGENCHPTTGYVSFDGQTNLGPYCHPAGTTGLGLGYSESLSAVITGQTGSNVIIGQKTAFPAPIEASEEETDDTAESENESYEFRVSYILKDKITGDCWAWGVEPTIFEDQGCKYPVPMSAISTNGKTRYRLE